MTKNQKIVAGICILVTILLIFQAGIMVGYHKAAFAYRNGDNYYRVFGREQFDLPGGHGAVGKIVRLNLPSLTIAQPDNVEKDILIDNQTQVRRSRTVIPAQELAVNSYVIVLGNPNATGQIVAKLIRVIPPPPGK